MIFVISLFSYLFSIVYNLFMFLFDLIPIGVFFNVARLFRIEYFFNLLFTSIVYDGYMSLAEGNIASIIAYGISFTLIFLLTILLGFYGFKRLLNSILRTFFNVSDDKSYLETSAFQTSIEDHLNERMKKINQFSGEDHETGFLKKAGKGFGTITHGWLGLFVGLFSLKSFQIYFNFLMGGNLNAKDDLDKIGFLNTIIGFLVGVFSLKDIGKGVIKKSFRIFFFLLIGVAFFLLVSGEYNVNIYDLNYYEDNCSNIESSTDLENCKMGSRFQTTDIEIKNISDILTLLNTPFSLLSQNKDNLELQTKSGDKYEEDYLSFQDIKDNNLSKIEWEKKKRREENEKIFNLAQGNNTLKNLLPKKIQENIEIYNNNPSQENKNNVLVAIDKMPGVHRYIYEINSHIKNKQVESEYLNQLEEQGLGEGSSGGDLTRRFSNKAYQMGLGIFRYFYTYKNYWLINYVNLIENGSNNSNGIFALQEIIINTTGVENLLFGGQGENVVMNGAEIKNKLLTNGNEDIELETTKKELEKDGSISTTKNNLLNSDRKFFNPEYVAKIGGVVPVVAISNNSTLNSLYSAVLLVLLFVQQFLFFILMGGGRLLHLISLKMLEKYEDGIEVNVDYKQEILDGLVRFLIAAFLYWFFLNYLFLQRNAFVM